MRRKSLGCGALALAAAMVSAGAHAQTEPKIPAEAMVDLRCAVWAGEMAGTFEGDAELEAAFSYVLTYFIGKFEGRTGRTFDDVATEGLVLEVVNDMEAMTDACTSKMQDIGDRMSAWGERIEAAAGGPLDAELAR